MGVSKETEVFVKVIGQTTFHCLNIKKKQLESFTSYKQKFHTFFVSDHDLLSYCFNIF